MKLYEVDIKSLWWVAADDEFEAIEIMRDELRNREVSDEDIDEAIDDMIVKELGKDDAEMISVVDEFGSTMSSLWSMFLSCRGPEVVTCDFTLEDLEEELE
jgi:hypothetical protein